MAGIIQLGEQSGTNQPLEEFCGLVNGYLAARGEEFEPVDQAGCFVDVGDEMIQLLLEPRRREATMAAALLPGVGDSRYLVPEIICDFNAINLFQGGCCLLVEEEFSGLYISRQFSLRDLAASGLGAGLEDFARRMGEWRQWYRRAAEPFWPSL